MAGVFKIDIRRLEYSEIILKISSLYWHPITLKKVVNNGQKPIFGAFF